MIKVININDRGTLTLPKGMRKRLGLVEGGQAVAEDTTDGILIRAGATFPLEVYSDRRIEEFNQNNEVALKGYRFRGKK